MTTGICDKGRVEKRVELWTPWGILNVERDNDSGIAPYKLRGRQSSQRRAAVTDSVRHHFGHDPAPGL